MPCKFVDGDFCTSCLFLCYCFHSIRIIPSNFFFFFFFIHFFFFLLAIIVILNFLFGFCWCLFSFICLSWHLCVAIFNASYIYYCSALGLCYGFVFSYFRCRLRHSFFFFFFGFRFTSSYFSFTCSSLGSSRFLNRDACFFFLFFMWVFRIFFCGDGCDSLCSWDLVWYLWWVFAESKNMYCNANG